jgi:peptide/nickel transport system substrate-binding protein
MYHRITTAIGGSSRPRRLRASLGVVVAASLLVAACGGDDDGSTSPDTAEPSSDDSPGTTAPAGGESTDGGAPTGIINVGMAKGDIDSIDPNRWWAAITWGIANGLCTTLLRYADEPGQAGVELVPGLADMPEVSADGTEYTFTLKEAYFANGDRVTPEDIKHTFLRLYAPDVATGSGGYMKIVGADEFANGDTDDISGITTTADAVTFKLEGPDGSFPYKISMPTTCPVGKDAPFEPDTDGTLLTDYATGPYAIESYTPEQAMTWVRNPHYNVATLGDRGQAAGMDFDIGIDPAQAALKIKAGDIDIYTGQLPTADVAQLSNDASLSDRVFVSERPATLTIFLNNTVAPFDNVKVRQAVNTAINRSQIQRVWGGPSTGTPTDQILPPSVPAYRDYDAYPNEPDIAAAQQLMDESGVTTPVTVTMRSRNDVAGFMEVAQVVQANLAEIGINIEIEGAIGSVDQAADGDPEAKTPMGLVTFSMDFPDGQAFINLLLDPGKPEFGGSYARFNDESFIPEYERVGSLTGEERAKAYLDLDEKVMTEAAPWAPLLTPTHFDFVSERLTGYVYSGAMDNVNYNTIGVAG